MTLFEVLDQIETGLREIAAAESTAGSWAANRADGLAVALQTFRGQGLPGMDLDVLARELVALVRATYRESQEPDRGEVATLLAFVLLTLRGHKGDDKPKQDRVARIGFAIEALMVGLEKLA